MVVCCVSWHDRPPSLQRALASRLRDLEMFSAGIAQQMIRRQERLQRALAQLEKGGEESKTGGITSLALS